MSKILNEKVCTIIVDSLLLTCKKIRSGTLYEGISVVPVK